MDARDGGDTPITGIAVRTVVMRVVVVMVVTAAERVLVLVRALMEAG